MKLKPKTLSFTNLNVPILMMLFISSEFSWFFEYPQPIHLPLRTEINWQPKTYISKSTSEHAVHIHQYGTIENENGDVNCDGSGPHFYKADQEHGKPENTPPERYAFLRVLRTSVRVQLSCGKDSYLIKSFRHYGDLGNIIRSVDGDMRLFFMDKHISLKSNNESYVGGRTLDFHEFKDDWSSSANSGRRVACCLIEHGDIVQMPDDNDVIMTSSTEKVTDTATTTIDSSTESNGTESTTTENSSSKEFLSIILSFYSAIIL